MWFPKVLCKCRHDQYQWDAALCVQNVDIENEELYFSRILNRIRYVFQVQQCIEIEPVNRLLNSRLLVSRQVNVHLVSLGMTCDQHLDRLQLLTFQTTITATTLWLLKFLMILIWHRSYNNSQKFFPLRGQNLISTRLQPVEGSSVPRLLASRKLVSRQVNVHRVTLGMTHGYHLQSLPLLAFQTRITATNPQILKCLMIMIWH